MSELSPATWLLGAAAVHLAICACCGWRVAGQKSRPVEEGILFGLLLGPIGVLVEVLMPGGIEPAMSAIPSSRPLDLSPVASEPAKGQFPAVDLGSQTRPGKPARRLLGEIKE